MERPSPPAAAATTVVLRPVATPLPLGFLALSVATLAFSSLQLGWIPPSQGHIVALAVLVLTVPLQLVASLIGFLARDPVAATGMGLLAGTWGTVGLATLTSPFGATNPGLGVILLGSSVCLLVPAVAARSKAVPAVVILTSAVRFAVTGAAELGAGQVWTHAAGWVGIVLAAISVYSALALELEGTESRTVLPLGRTRGAAEALDGRVGDQTEGLATEPGVRQQL